MKMMVQSKWHHTNTSYFMMRSWKKEILFYLKRGIGGLLFLLSAGHGYAQTLPRPSIEIIATAPIKSIRGLSIGMDQSVWVSGTGGMVGRSTDHGKSWQWVQVPGCDSCDWRNIKAFDQQKAVVINAGEPAHAFLTENGGQTWQSVYFNNTKGIFFDGVAFMNAQEGFAIGDPLEGKFAMLRTINGGKTWALLPPAALPTANPGEALFAASGTGMQIWQNGDIYFATGGTTSRFFKRHQQAWQSYPLPLIQGSSSTGAFSIAFWSEQTGIVVGGDYQNDTLRQGNCALTNDGGVTWHAPKVPPSGYRSAVVYLSARWLLATGPSGTDFSIDGGEHWYNISKEGFHVVQVKANRSIYLAGAGGKIARLVIGAVQ